MQKVSGWGLYPLSNSEVLSYRNGLDLPENTWINRGMGRSYGDASLGPVLVHTGLFKRLLDFDKEKGILTCEAGLSIRELSEVFLSRGWSLPVSPGTQDVSIGGSIAAEVHGKNHHQVGAFSDHLISCTLLAPNGQIYTCSAEKNQDLFWATIGGMGLSGMVLEAKLQLVPLNSAWMEVQTVQTKGIESLLDGLNEMRTSPYLVAWFDGFDRNHKGWIQAASILSEEKISPKNPFAPHTATRYTIPTLTPGGLLNPISMRLYNGMRYQLIRKSQKLHMHGFLYPLDRLKHWNRFYGKKGFVQYQFMLPEAIAATGINEILLKAKSAGQYPYLSVLKLMGKASPGMLAFPGPGISLAMDFPIKNGLMDCLDQLDKILVEHGGRIYLAKDARLSSKAFRQMYPNLDAFRGILNTYKGKYQIRSAMSDRLHILED